MENDDVYLSDTRDMAAAEAFSVLTEPLLSI